MWWFSFPEHSLVPSREVLPLTLGSEPSDVLGPNSIIVDGCYRIHVRSEHTFDYLADRTGSVHRNVLMNSEHDSNGDAVKVELPLSRG
jgi:hypothetical protein